MEQHIVDNQPQLALETFAQRTPSKRNRVLHALNLAILLRMNGDYVASNNALEQAKQFIDELDAVSVTEQTGTFVINEAVASYVGEEFERALIHFYAALNYLQLGELDEARVEALQVDLLLTDLGKRKPDDPRVYTEDALCRYLTGIIYEALGDWSDALIAYRKAFEAYEKYAQSYGVSAPRFLKKDLLRLTQRQGLKGEFKAYREQFSIEQWPSFNELQKHGEVIFILHSGLAPIKRSHVTRAVDPKSGQVVSIALPAYQRRHAPVQRVEVTVAGINAKAVPVEDVSAIAERSLEARLPLLTAKAVARAVIKYNLTNQTQKEHGDLAGLLANVASLITEFADTRSWTLLPDKIYMARLVLEPGHYQMAVELKGVGAQTLARFEFSDVSVQANTKHFFEKHWVSGSASLGAP